MYFLELWVGGFGSFIWKCFRHYLLFMRMKNKQKNRCTSIILMNTEIKGSWIKTSLGRVIPLLWTAVTPSHWGWAWNPTDQHNAMCSYLSPHLICQQFVSSVHTTGLTLTCGYYSSGSAQVMPRFMFRRTQEQDVSFALHIRHIKHVCFERRDCVPRYRVSDDRQ